MCWRIIVIAHADDWTSTWDVQLALEGCHVERRDWSACSPSCLGDVSADLVLAIALGDPAQPVEWFSRLRTQHVTVPIFAVLPPRSGNPLLPVAAETCADFVVWPVELDEMRQRLGRILGASPTQVEMVRDRLVSEIALKQLVGADPAFLGTIAQIPLIARSNRPVLITGATGTGKELSARAIHHLGQRRNCPFIAIDCGAFPDHLFENEMFGHARGAFTDAHRDQRGLIAMAEGGTLFLDEIDSLSPSAQGKLLRFLQERVYRPLGADRFVAADVNVLAATNRDLDALVNEQRFRSDLFFRLSVLRLHLMPLGERPDDIPILARHFLNETSAGEQLPKKILTPAAVTELQRHHWPGNVRELHNVMQRVFFLATGPQVRAAHIIAALARRTEAPPPETGAFRDERARAMEAFDRHYVIEMLKTHNGNITQAARHAGQDRRAFGRLVKRLNLNRRAG